MQMKFEVCGGVWEEKLLRFRDGVVEYGRSYGLDCEDVGRVSEKSCLVYGSFQGMVLQVGRVGIGLVFDIFVMCCGVQGDVIEVFYGVFVELVFFVVIFIWMGERIQVGVIFFGVLVV